MTRKDYQVIATALIMVAGVPVEHLITVALYIADELERAYPNFDRDKFLNAAIPGYQVHSHVEVAR